MDMFEISIPGFTINIIYLFLYCILLVYVLLLLTMILETIFTKKSKTKWKVIFVLPLYPFAIIHNNVIKLPYVDKLQAYILKNS
jgi:hypothetical protein